MDKICKICSLSKELNEDNFHKRKDSKDGFDRECKICRRKRNLDNYYKNHQKWRKTHTKTRLEKKEKLQEIRKSNPCSKCNDGRFYVIDFHHLDPKQKDFQISQGESKGWEAILKEIEKCIALCKNCHAEFHYLEKTENITIEEYLNAK